MKKADYLKIWGYLDILQTDFENRHRLAEAKAADAATDEDKERYRRLVRDYSKNTEELIELKGKVEVEAEKAED